MVKDVVFTKKLRLIPVGDKEEINRVYKYIRDGQYFQYRLRNYVISQMAALYFKYDRDIKNENFKEELKGITRVENLNHIIDNYLKDKDGNPVSRPKGLSWQGDISQTLKGIFFTAIKTGFASGEKSLPTFKRTNPLSTDGRFLRFEKVRTEYNGKERDEYLIKWVNKIWFKVVLGTRGRRDYSLMETLEKVSDGTYKTCCSSILVNDSGEIILNLAVKKTVDLEEVKSNRVMGVAIGYDKPIMVTFSDKDRFIPVGSEINFIEKRTAMQAHRQRLQSALSDTNGGKGRKKKLQALDRISGQEKNFAKNYNHILSKQIVEIAEKNDVAVIVLEDIKYEDIKKYPTLLRNWSYSDLYFDIKYKAERIGIKVVTSETAKKEFLICTDCGESFAEVFSKEKSDNDGESPDENNVNEFTWSKNLTFACPHCGKMIDYGKNKAKILATA